MERVKFSNPVSLKEIQVTDAFWEQEMELVRKEVIPYQWAALNDQVEGAAPAFASIILKWQGKCVLKRSA